MPGAFTKNTGDESRLLFTLPWRGRVERLNDSESVRGGVTPPTANSPHPARVANAALATLPLQGRVKKKAAVQELNW